MSISPDNPINIMIRRKYMKVIQIFTDGACSGNPGYGGWGAILNYKGIEKEISGAEKNTTNNRMELTAFIKALEILKEPCKITAYSDSKYLCDALSKNWIEKWQKNNWKKSDNKPVINVDLWQRLVDIMKPHLIQLIWVKGHAGHPENERCDKLATEAIKKLKQK